MSVEPSSDRRSPDSQIIKTIECLFQAMDVAVKETCPAAELLADGQRYSVLEMSAANFDDVLKFLGFRGDCVAHHLHSGNQNILYALGGSDMHGRRKCVVGGLRHVDVIVGVDWLFRAHLAPSNLDSAVRDHLIDVHVSLRAAARLPYAERELVVELAGDYFVGGLHDQLGLVSGQFAEILVDECASLFQDAKSANQFRGHGVASNIEVLERPLRLSAPVNIPGNFDLSHAVGFDSGGLFYVGSHSTPDSAKTKGNRRLYRR